MAVLQVWTTTRLINFSGWIAKAFGLGFDTTQPTPPGDTWTAESLVNFGLQISKGFGLGL
jgi:hypothetical protein